MLEGFFPFISTVLSFHFSSPADDQLLHGGYVCTSVTQVARDTSSASAQSSWGRFGGISAALDFSSSVINLFGPVVVHKQPGLTCYHLC